MTTEEKRKEPLKKQVIDLKAGALRFQGDQEIAKKMLVLLVESLPATKHEIECAFREKNTKKLIFTVDQLNGAVCYCGTPRLQDAVREFQLAIELNDDKNIKKLYGPLMVEIESVMDNFKKI